MITRGLKSVWDAWHGRFRWEIAVSHMYPSMLERIVHVAADSLKLFNHEWSEYVLVDDDASERW